MYQESTKALLRPNQVEELTEERKRIEATLNAPPHVQAAIQNPGELRRQLHSIVGSLESQSPKEYHDEEKDAAVARERQLLDEIRAGMPTQKEMRRNPAGAVDKHMQWEERNKEKIQEWKNIRLRMHATGMLDERRGATDVANLERFRPEDTPDELNMHNEQIPGRIQYGPVPGSLPSVITDAEKSVLEAIDPELAQTLAALNNEQRAAIKAHLQEVLKPTEQTVRYHEDYEAAKNPPRGGKQPEWTPEMRKAHGEKIRAARKKKK